MCAAILHLALLSVCPFVSQQVCKSVNVDSNHQFLYQKMSECHNLAPTPYQVCFLLSVNQSVSLLIELTNLSVSK